MKIRMDFVTNSSSSSFICITVRKKDGEYLEGGYRNDDGYFYGRRILPNVFITMPQLWKAFKKTRELIIE